MKAIQTGTTVAVIAIAAALGACSSWRRTDKGTGAATGAVGGAVAGAVVAGPAGAVVGGVGGAVVGHETTGKDQVATTRSTTTMCRTGSMSAYDSATIQRVQRALDTIRGFKTRHRWTRYVRRVDAGCGPGASSRHPGCQQPGELGRPTLSALGVS